MKRNEIHFPNSACAHCTLLVYSFMNFIVKALFMGTAQVDRNKIEFTLLEHHVYTDNLQFESISKH